MKEGQFFQPTSENKTSGVDRVIGVNEEDEKGIKEYFSKIFQEDIFENEEEALSGEFLQIFPGVKRCLDEFLNHYGAKSLDISPAAIKVINPERVSSEARERIDQQSASAFYCPQKQKIILFANWKEGGKLEFLYRLVHEMIHVKAFESWQNIYETGEDKRALSLRRGEEETRIGIRRIGFRIMKKNGEVSYFYDIDEAIVTELTMRFGWKFFYQFPELIEELRARDEAIETFAKRDGRSLEKERRSISHIKFDKEEDGRMRCSICGYSYSKERNKFMNLCKDIFQSNHEKFASVEQVFDEFAKAVMTGKLLSVARMIEQTYGKGSFRRVGEETARKHSEERA